MAAKSIQIDPWSQGDLSRLKPADLILITDDVNHHLDVKAIAKLRKPGAPVVIAANGLKQVPDGIVMANGDTRDVAGFKVEATAAYDVTPGVSFHPKGEANGYIVTIGGKRIYIVGVTECVPEIRAAKDIDVAFFPLNLPAAAHGAGGRDRLRQGVQAKGRLPVPLRSGLDHPPEPRRATDRANHARAAGDERRTASRGHRSALSGVVPAELGLSPLDLRPR